MCVLLCEHGIACAFRWRVAIVGVILTGHYSPRRGTPFLGISHVQATDPYLGPHV